MPGTLILFKEKAQEYLGIVRRGIRVEEFINKIREARKRADNTFTLEEIGTSEKELRRRLKAYHTSEYAKYSRAAGFARSKKEWQENKTRANYHFSKM